MYFYCIPLYRQRHSYSVWDICANLWIRRLLDSVYFKSLFTALLKPWSGLNMNGFIIVAQVQETGHTHTHTHTHTHMVRGQHTAVLPCDSGLDWRGRRRCRLSGPQAAECLVGQNLFCQSNCKEKEVDGPWVRERGWGRRREEDVCVCVHGVLLQLNMPTHKSRWQPVMLCPLLLCVPGSMRKSLMACGTLVWVCEQVLTSTSLLTHHLKRSRNVPRLSKVFTLRRVRMLIGFCLLYLNEWVRNLLRSRVFLQDQHDLADNDFLRKLINILFEIDFFCGLQFNSLIQRYEWCKGQSFVGQTEGTLSIFAVEYFLYAYNITCYIWQNVYYTNKSRLHEIICLN